MIHSPPLSIKRVSEKLSIAQRIAAQEEDASSPTAVTIPEDIIAMGGINSVPCPDCFGLSPAAIRKMFERRVPRLTKLAGAVPSPRHSPDNDLRHFKHIFL